MKWIAFIIASIQAVSSCVGAKDLIVPQEFSTIQAAIDASQATDTVIVKAGTYDESISLKSGVTIRGEDRPNTVVRCSSLESPVVRATGCTDATLTNLTLTHTDANQVLPDKAESFAVVFINAATIDVNGCHIHQAGDCGVLVPHFINSSTM